MIDFKQYLAEDLKKYEGIQRPEKSGFLKRLIIRKLSPRKLHANPEDEFSMPNIGPSLSIIGQYEKEYNTASRTHEKKFKERIVIEKMSPDGYLILNGHHRWAAALKSNAKRIRVQLVNSTSIDDIHQMLKNSKHKKRATFDLDDIMLAAPGEVTDPIRFPYSFLFKERMHPGIASFIQALVHKQYDIWVFTSTYHSEKYYRKFFELYGIPVTGIVIGMNRKKAAHTQTSASLASAFHTKYNMSITLFKDSILYTNSHTKKYEIIETGVESLTASKSIMKKIEQIEQLSQTESLEG